MWTSQTCPILRSHFPSILLLGLLLFTPLGGLKSATPPSFHVPGQEKDMRALNELHALHQDRAFSDCTLWDGWLPAATLWTDAAARDRYRASFLSRRIDPEGYVSMQQHRGMAHSEGWPFPAWQQSTGMGFHFSIHDEVWAIQYFGLKPLTNTSGWEFHGASVEGIDPLRGLMLKATNGVIQWVTPAFRCGTIVAPFARLEWSAQGLSPLSQARISWLLEGETEWREDRYASFPSLRDDEGQRYVNVPLYRQPGYAGIVTRYRVTIDHASGARVALKSIITAIDTRHPITNPLYVTGCVQYFNWTHDLPFLRQNIGRMRTALRFALAEFSVRTEKHVRVPWVGHDGRSGLVLGVDGRKTVRPGLGVGNNYWDLLPFGGHDALATQYVFAALQDLAGVEQAIQHHPEWGVPREDTLDADTLLRLAGEVRSDFQTRFWNANTGRFVGWQDMDGHGYDYGFTFVNLEAIHYGLASALQARNIFAWLDGDREVPGDTARGASIYHWRFGPRATTRRNVETYTWPWSGPESIPWGDQVQDGGAVLGFSYHDLMARLKAKGPDDAWKRLREILAWFREVQSEGGYRAYYARPGRGHLQGGGPPGGLGLDQEFLESVLVPQVMLYGFLGVIPEAEGFTIKPSLPHDWPSLTVSNVLLHDRILNLTAYPGGRIQIQTVRSGAAALKVRTAKSTIPLPPSVPGTSLDLP